MAVPWDATPEYGPTGYTYAAVLVRVPAGDGPPVLETLQGIRFSGWVAPPDDGWLPVVPAGDGTVAARRRGVVGVAEELARSAGTVLALRVLHDRQLVL